MEAHRLALLDGRSYLDDGWRRESKIEAFLREEFPGFIPFAIMAAGLLVIGVVILRMRGQ